MKDEKKMHELFKQVLSNRDLSRAGDLFSIPDAAIVNDLSQVLKEIVRIAEVADYVTNDNDQSVVEICVTRVTACVRDTQTCEKYCEDLLALLATCLSHDLKPLKRDDDPPHAKIAADLIACLFTNYNNKVVMEKAMPIAVKFLQKDNKELSRNLSSYLSLAAFEHAPLLATHTQSIIEAICVGNLTLTRILPQIYESARKSIHDNIKHLLAILPQCDAQQKNALFVLFAAIARNTPTLLQSIIVQLCEYLNDVACVTNVLQIFVNICERKPHMLHAHWSVLKQTATKFPQTTCVVSKIIATSGKTSRDCAFDALNFILDQLPRVDRASQNLLLRDASALCSAHPVLFTDRVVTSIKLHKNASSASSLNHSSSNQINQLCGGVTIVKVGGAAPAPHLTNISQQATAQTAANLPFVAYTPTYSNTNGTSPIYVQNGCHNGCGSTTGGNNIYTPRRAKLGDSRSTGRLHTTTIVNGNATTASNTPHRSMTRLNIAGGSVGGLHKSMSRLVTSSSSQQIQTKNTSATNITTGAMDNSSQNICTQNKWHAASTLSSKIVCGGVTVTTASKVPPLRPGTTMPPPTQVSVSHTTPGPGVSATTVTPRRANAKNNNTTVTLLNVTQNVANQRISVFEPYPMRDTIQHFCEKHLDKIKAYMRGVQVRIPPPAKCTIEERRAKKQAKLHFACQARGQHCLYARTMFTMRTRHPRIWIHLMFLALQARATHALSSREAAVASLKLCWDMHKSDNNKTFLTLVTGAFPCIKEQEMLLNELKQSGFFDVFQLGPTINDEASTSDNLLQWGCFLCTHPDKAVGFLANNTQPVIEGQLKEKKGRWRLFRRWRTRYFTLSGAHLSVKGSSGGESIDINQIRSVKVSRGARNIPKAFEIFTEDQSLILKPTGGQNAEEWVKCLSIALAHNQAKESPAAKSNSLPARGFTASRALL